jgi:cell division protein FtsZ
MGTGEASGEKRANRAAEAAIANPLLDDVSMKGARGLLISITGGRDLTLYELDEAATRIREEVDQEANIILGATFDESLEGTIRVSVVATGIDKIEEHESPIITATEQRIAEVADRLRAEARMRAVAPAPVSTPVIRTSFQPETPVSRPVEPVHAAAEIVAQASAEVNAAPVVHDEVAMPAMPTAYDHYPEAEMELEAPVAPAQPFIPPQAERAMRPTRMPRVEDLPVPGQKQLRAVRGEPDASQQEKRTLLQRLATVGFGRRDDMQMPVAADSVPVAPQPAKEPVARNVASPAHAEYVKRAPAAPAYRPAQGNLDAQGRMPAAPRNNVEDDHLEIPAFLRRQSN